MTQMDLLAFLRYIGGNIMRRFLQVLLVLTAIVSSWFCYQELMAPVSAYSSKMDAAPYYVVALFSVVLCYILMHLPPKE